MSTFVHLFIDDKFIDFFCGLNERVFPGQSRYFVACDGDRLVHVRNEQVERVHFDGSGTASLLAAVRDCQVLVIHFLTDFALEIIGAVPPGVTIVWSGWGADYYERMPGFSRWAYCAHTDAALRTIRSSGPKPGLFKRAGDLYREKRGRYLFRKHGRRIDFFSAPLPEDYEVLVANFPELRPRYLQLNYATVERTFLQGPATVSGSDILVGNSADPANNHLEIFQVLQKAGLGNRLVYVPLSYGDSDYGTYVIKEGRRLFGEQFRPLVEFLPLDEYHRIIGRCGVVIMNHLRQQALGNIGAMMYKGARIFLNQNSVAYDFFSKRGAVVNGLDAPFDSGLVSAPLTAAEIARNRSVLESFWSNEVVEKNLKALGEIARAVK